MASGAPAVVLGGGVAGLAAARALERHFGRVLVLERDERPPVDGPDDAFDGWERGGVPQFRHSHAFLARLRLLLLAHLPDVLDRLRGAGVREIALADTAPPRLRLRPVPDDEDVVLLACRRSTFEWALRESAMARPGITLREGVTVAGLVGGPGPQGRPQVTGVRLADDTVVPASLVVDALGRRSAAPAWLTALGAPTPRERSADTGIVYYTRFYRLLAGPPPSGGTGLVAGDLGWIKLAIFPGDAGTFSVTVGAPVHDVGLRRMADSAAFERFLCAFPQVAPWRTPGTSVPIGGEGAPVLGMGHLRNRLRLFVDDAGPLASGFLAVGDAAYHSNPIYGRGCTMAVMQAALLDEAVGSHPRDPVAAARRLHAASERHLRPFWDAAVAADRRAAREPAPLPANGMAALATLAERGVAWFLERGVLPATRTDGSVFRALLRIFHMLEPPERLVRDPEILLRALPTLARGLAGGELPEAPMTFVPRAAAVARLDAAA